MINQPFDSVTAASDESDVLTLNKVSGKDELTVQVSISASAVVSVQGRLSADAPWVELTSITTSTIQPLALVTQLKFVLSGNNGTVDVYVRS